MSTKTAKRMLVVMRLIPISNARICADDVE